jgi:hypothetical protein
VIILNKPGALGDSRSKGILVVALEKKSALITENPRFEQQYIRDAGMDYIH